MPGEEARAEDDVGLAVEDRRRARCRTRPGRTRGRRPGRSRSRRVASAKPARSAAPLPWLTGCRSTRTRRSSNSARMSRVPSVEPSSTMRTSRRARRREHRFTTSRDGGLLVVAGHHHAQAGLGRRRHGHGFRATSRADWPNGGLICSALDPTGGGHDGGCRPRRARRRSGSCPGRGRRGARRTSPAGWRSATSRPRSRPGGLVAEARAGDSDDSARSHGRTGGS